MKKISIGKDVFINYKIGKANFNFSTGENQLDYSMDNDIFKTNIENLKRNFQVENVGYLKQIHSDKVYNFNGNVMEGDGLITNRKNVAIGVFTADCVPLLLYDEGHNVISAVHSGWKGTMKNILSNAINKMKLEYKSDTKDIYLVIGPHIRKCCYTIGNELIEEFKKSNRYIPENFKNGKLDLAGYIIDDGIRCGLDVKKIIDVKMCTFCSNTINFNSYRREKQKAGRQFSFIYLS